MDIGKHIKYYRLQKGVKQEDLADYLNVSFQAVSKWETGASMPDITLLPKLAIYFGITIDELFQIPDEEKFERIESLVMQERSISPAVFDGHIKFLKDIISENPDHIRANELLAELYNHRAHSDHETASEYAKKILYLDPDSKSAWVSFLEANNGRCGDGWYDNHFKVTTFFEELIQKYPDNYGAHLALVENLIADGHCQAAKPYVEHMKEMKNRYITYFYLGDIALRAGKREEAISLWNEGVESDPERWQTYCSRADRFYQLEEYDAAIKDYETCLSIQTAPRYTDGLYSLAQIHELQKDYSSAINDYKRLIEILKTEFHMTESEELDFPLREIARLQKLAQ